jgi:hypothetical protein
MLGLTTGLYENRQDLEGLALTILEDSAEAVVKFSDDASPNLQGAVYAVLTNVLPNRWRAHYREVLCATPRVSLGCRVRVLCPAPSLACFSAS